MVIQDPSPIINPYTDIIMGILFGNFCFIKTGIRTLDIVIPIPIMMVPKNIEYTLIWERINMPRVINIIDIIKLVSNESFFVK